MQILWVCDPWDRINQPTETTIRLIEESISLGHVNWFCVESDICYSDGKVSVRAHLLKKANGNNVNIAISRTPTHHPVTVFQYIYLRVDPPFRSSYRTRLQLLLTHLKSDHKTTVINHPSTLLTVNSKVVCTYFTGQTPETLITSDEEAIKQFCREKGAVIIKPTDGSLSHNVKILNFRSEPAARQAHIFLETISSRYTEPVVLQEHITRSYEIRAWFSNGHLVEAAKKKAMAKATIFVPNNKITVSRYRATRDDLQVLERISLFLKAERINLAAVDIIKGKIIDFNISSPGLLVEFENAFKKNLAKQVLLNSLGEF